MKKLLSLLKKYNYHFYKLFSTWPAQGLAYPLDTDLSSKYSANKATDMELSE